jgi:hypothetical protein
MDMRIWLSTPVRTLVVVPAAPAGGRWNLANGATPDHGEHGRPADTRVIFGREFNAQASATRTGRRHLAVVDEACRRQAACWRSAAARSAGSSRRYEPRGTTPKASTPRQPAAAIVASTSLHHVSDLDTVFDRITGRLEPGGVLVVIEWARERFDEATARCASTGSPTANPAGCTATATTGSPPAKPGTPTSAAGPPARACTPVRTSCARWPPDS